MEGTRTYLVIDSVKEHGSPISREHGRKHPSIPQGQRLVAILSGSGMPTCAVDVTDEDTFYEYYDSYYSGYYEHMELYLLPENLLEEFRTQG